MTKITLLIGLPGSGKSFLGNQLAIQGAYFIDDISYIRGLDLFREAILTKPYVVVADTFLCRKKDQEIAIDFLKEFHDIEVEWIFFENNPDKCRRSVVRRNDGRRVDGLIRQLSLEYVIPDGVTPREIYDAD